MIAAFIFATCLPPSVVFVLPTISRIRVRFPVPNEKRGFLSREAASIGVFPGVFAGVLEADLAAAADDSLIGRQFGEPDGTAGVQFLRADAHLRAQPELVAIGESGGGVDENAGRIHLTRKALRRVVVAGNDGLGVAGAI